MLLRDLLLKKLAGWKDDLPVNWRKILRGTELNFESRGFLCEFGADEIIIPVAKERRFRGPRREPTFFARSMSQSVYTRSFLVKTLSEPWMGHRPRL